jgi:hypothetical protein
MASQRRRRPSKKPGTEHSAAGKRRAFFLPLALTLGLAMLSWLPRVQDSPVPARSFRAAVIVLLFWQTVLFLRLRAESKSRYLRVQLRPQHYVQAACQFSVYAYWGYHWRPVYDYAWLLIAQLVFAYAFDMLLQWSRRESYLLGLGPFPIVFSTNLFLWFRDEWFYLQFLMIAVGFLGKEFVRWNRDGRRVHIFNPSAFTLALFSLVLIATHTTDLTWGRDIATTLSLAPHIYLFLFLVGLVVMYFFSITLLAATAAGVLFGASALYAAVTGVPYFIDSEIPTAVFLGLHLLVTDPSTSPRTPPGKLVFGAMYGVGVFVLYALLGATGAPTFYDKLLSVPLLNLSVRWIDRFVSSISDTAWIRRSLDTANLVHMSVWAAFFSVMASAGATDGTHRGDTVPFWEQSCAEGRRRACERLLSIESTYCGDNSGWACNELGRHHMEGKITGADSDVALSYFSRSCQLRFQAGCVNLLDPESPRRADPRALDLRLLLREGGPNLMEMPEPELYARACEHRWTFACGGAKRDKGKGPARVSGVSK